MRLSNAPAQYDRDDEARNRSAIQTADAENFKKGNDVILAVGQRLVIPDESTGALYRLKVLGGTLSLVAYP